MGVRTDVVREEPLDLQCLTTIWVTFVVEDVYIHLDNLTSEFWSNLGASSIFTWAFAETASAACPSKSGSLAMTSITFFRSHL